MDEHTVNKIMKMSRADRTAIAHGLLMEMEKAGDITCWVFWERDTIKEIMEETICRDAKHDELNSVMNALNKHHLDQSSNDWHNFSDILNNKMQSLGIGFNAPKTFFKPDEESKTK